MKKFFIFFAFILAFFLFSLSASAFSLTADLEPFLNSSDARFELFDGTNLISPFDFSFDLDSSSFNAVSEYLSSLGFSFVDRLTYLRRVSDNYGYVGVYSVYSDPQLIFPSISIFDLIDNTDFNISVSVLCDRSLFLEVSSSPDFSDVLYSWSFPSDSSFHDYDFSFPFSYSSFKNGFVYIRLIEKSDFSFGVNYISFTCPSFGDASIQDTSSFSDLQYILDLLKSFFFGGSVSDPDTGESFSFGEDGSGGIMNFVVYSSGSTNFALWHLLVAAAIVGLGISFVIRLAGNLGSSGVSDSAAESLHKEDDSQMTWRFK